MRSRSTMYDVSECNNSSSSKKSNKSKKSTSRNNDMNGHESEPEDQLRSLSNKKQVLSEERHSLEKALNESLDTLIAYFGNNVDSNQQLAAASQQQQQQQVGSSNFLETSDTSSRVYYQLALHAKQVLSRVIDTLLLHI